MSDMLMPQRDDNTPQHIWTVTRVEDSFAPSLTNPSQRVKRVYFRLFDGTESYVDVPLQSFTREVVEQLVDEHARQLTNVLTLRSQGTV